MAREQPRPQPNWKYLECDEKEDAILPQLIYSTIARDILVYVRYVRYVRYVQERLQPLLILSFVENYVGIHICLHQNWRRCIQIFSGRSPSDASSTTCRRTWNYKVVVWPRNHSWPYVCGSNDFSLQKDTYTGVWMIGKSCGPINQPFSAPKVARDVWDGIHSSAGWTLHTTWALSSTQYLSWFGVVSVVL